MVVISQLSIVKITASNATQCTVNDIRDNIINSFINTVLLIKLV